LRNLVGSLNFVFAKKLSHIPHWYMRWADNEAGFQALRAAIKQYGVRETFQGHSYRYLLLDPWKYWAIPPIPVINRASTTHDWNEAGHCRHCGCGPAEVERPCPPRVGRKRDRLRFS
jgi:hypothetical protein